MIMIARIETGFKHWKKPVYIHIALTAVENLSILTPHR